MWSSYPYPTSTLYAPNSYSPVDNSSFLGYNTNNVSSSTSGISSFNSSVLNENYLNNYYNSSVSANSEETSPNPVVCVNNIKLEAINYPNLPLYNPEPRSNSVCSDLSADTDAISQTSTPNYQRYLPTTLSYYNNNQSYSYPYYQAPEQLYASSLATQYYPTIDYQTNYFSNNYFINSISNQYNYEPNLKLNDTQAQKEDLPLKEKNLNLQQNSILKNNNTQHFEQKPSLNITNEAIYQQKANEKVVINCNDIDFKYPSQAHGNPNIKVKLQDMDLWKRFNKIGTEMIITKTGRRMFPSIRVSVTGLVSSSKYIMFIDMVPYDDNRYKFQNGEWGVNGKSEPHFSGL